MTKGAGVTVAVIDSGVNARLPDLRPAVLPGKDFQPADGSSPGSGDGRTDTDAKNGGHGTGMASLIASQGTTSGYLGVAPESKILPIVSSMNSTAEAIAYAAANGAKVISVSQGHAGPCPANVQAAVGQAIQRDAVVVAAAGNEGDTTNTSVFPANCAGVVAVGAVDNQKRAWASTQRQPYVSVAAPGDMVGALLKNGRFEPRLSGSSQAAALASAAVALVRAKNPQMKNREVVQRIIATAVDAGPPGRDDQTGAGIIVPSRALTANVPPSAPNPVFAKYDQWAGTQPNAPKAPPSVDPKWQKASDKAESNTKKLLIGGLIGAAVLVVVVAVIIGIAAKRRKPKGPQGTPPNWGGPSGPPPGQQTPPPYGPPGQQFPPSQGRPGPGGPPQQGPPR
ncbi:S8 family serine peptidase [Spirillospora sp. NPDC050679]